MAGELLAVRDAKKAVKRRGSGDLGDTQEDGKGNRLERRLKSDREGRKAEGSSGKPLNQRAGGIKAFVEK